MKWLLRTLLLWTVTAPICANAQTEVPQTIVGVKGECKSISLPGNPAKCARAAGIIFTVLQNGRSLISIALADGRVVSFVGEKDSQPRPELYYLYLSRIRIVSRGSEFRANVAGQCIVDMSDNGRVWSKVDCSATDENSASYEFAFKPSETAVDVEHPNAPGSVNVGKIGHVDARTIAQITARFKAALATGGIQEVARDLEKCFDDGLGKVPVIRACMLYDISAVRFDNSMRKMFVSRGVDVGIQIPFLSDRAFDARMGIYSAMAFSGSEAEAYQYFANGPNIVMEGLSK